MIFVRHGLPVVQADGPAHEWPLDPAHIADVWLAAVIPGLPVVCSDMRRAVETARVFGEPAIDPRLSEVSRPWTDDLERDVARSFGGETLAGWEPPADARARMQAAVEELGVNETTSAGIERMWGRRPTDCPSSMPTSTGSSVGRMPSRAG